MKKYQKKLLPEQLQDTGYTLKLYVTEKVEKNPEFVVSLATWGSKLSEVYKKFKNKQEAIKEWTSIITKITKDFKKL